MGFLTGAKTGRSRLRELEAKGRLRLFGSVLSEPQTRMGCR